jgi:anti-sigma B factor antagonist
MAYLLHEPTGDPPVVRAEGELDLASAPGLRDLLARLIVEGHRHVILDLSGTTFIDSTSIGTLLAAHQRLRRYNGILELVCGHPNVLRTFEFAGLRDEFLIRETTEAPSHAVVHSA